MTVAPSAALWLQASAQPRPDTDAVALVSGPDLPAGQAEVAALARSYPGARRLTGRRASARAAAAALDGAALAHVAARGSFRSYHPLFSALSMADGLLMVYDP